MKNQDRSNEAMEEVRCTLIELGTELEKLANVFAEVMETVEEVFVPIKKPWYVRLKIKMKGWFK